MRNLITLVLIFTMVGRSPGHSTDPIPGDPASEDCEPIEGGCVPTPALTLLVRSKAADRTKVGIQQRTGYSTTGPTRYYLQSVETETRVEIFHYEQSGMCEDDTVDETRSMTKTTTTTVDKNSWSWDASPSHILEACRNAEAASSTSCTGTFTSPGCNSSYSGCSWSNGCPPGWLQVLDSGEITDDIDTYNRLKQTADYTIPDSDSTEYCSWSSFISQEYTYDYQLSNEYTTSQLKTDAFADLDGQEWDEWGPGNPAGYLTVAMPSEGCVSIRSIEYAFQVEWAHPDDQYEVSWKEVSIIGGEVKGAKQNREILTGSDIIVGKTYQIRPPTGDNDWHRYVDASSIVFKITRKCASGSQVVTLGAPGASSMGTATLARKQTFAPSSFSGATVGMAAMSPSVAIDQSSATSSCGSCASGTGTASPEATLSAGAPLGSGQPSLAAGPTVLLSLGRSGFSQGVGLLGFGESEASLAWSKPTNMTFFGTETYGECMTNSTCGIKQVMANDGLADVVIVSPFKYKIDFYTPSQIGAKTDGLYLTSGTPFVSWTVENPNTNSPNLLAVLETRGSKVITNLFSYDPPSRTWELSAANGLRLESYQITNSGNFVIERHRMLQPGAGYIVEERTKTFRQTTNGLQLIEDRLPTDLEDYGTRYDYYTNGLLKTTIYPNGAWERREYDAQRRLTFLAKTWGDTTNTNSSNYGTAYDYASNDVSDDLSRSPGIPRTETEWLDGQIIRKVFRVFTSSQTIEAVATEPAASYASSSNLRTITTRYTSGPWAGDLLSVTKPDQTRSVYFYAEDATERTETVLTGEPDASNSTNVVKGRKILVKKNVGGQVLLREEFDIESEVKVDRVSYSNFDNEGRAQTVTYLDGSTEQRNYDCCYLSSLVDRSGVTNSFVYDDLKLQTASVRNGIAALTAYTAADHVGIVSRQGTNGNVIVQKGKYYTHPASIIETNALGGMTWVGRASLANGYYLYKSRFERDTNSYPVYLSSDQSYFYRDGQPKLREGSAVHRMAYSAGIEFDGHATNRFTYEIRKRVDGTDTSSEWTKTYMDLMGRTAKIVYAAASGPYPERRMLYNNLGQLSQEIDPDGVTTTYLYNGLGEQEYRIVDVTGGTNFASMDRITRTVRDVASHSTSLMGMAAHRTRHYVWDQDNTDSARLAATTEVDVGGRTNWSIVHVGGNNVITKSVRTLPDGNGSYSVTVTDPDGSQRISQYLLGKLQSVQRTLSNGTQTEKTSYVYDAHGRVAQSVDARNGATVYSYNNMDQVTSVTAPPAGDGGIPQTTTTVYDKYGRATRVIHPDGSVVTNEYTWLDLVTRTYGSRTYPVGYGYDRQGRMTSMTNWSGFDLTSPSGARVTTWSFNTYRGWLDNKRYQDGNGPDYTYTAGGKLATRTWARNRPSDATRILTSYGYSAGSGDLATVIYNDGTPGMTNSYDRLGRLFTVARNGITTTQFWNHASLLTGEAYAGGTLAGLSVSNVYNSLLQRTSVSVPSKMSGTYAYDTASRLTSVTDGTYSTAYSYLANSRLAGQLTMKESSTTRVTTTKTYDFLNRLAAIVSQPSGSGESLVSFAYRYNDANQRVRTTGEDGSAWSYSYDTLGQVTSGKRAWADGTPVAGQQFEYGFDTIGNRTVAREGGDATGAAGALRTSSYTNNALNQLTSRGVPSKVDLLGVASAAATVTVSGTNSGVYRKGSYFRKEHTVTNNTYPTFTITAINGATSNTISGEIFVPPGTETFTYDFDGNLTTDGRWTCSWDAENRLTQIESLSSPPAGSQRKLVFEYDHLSRRIRKTVYENGSGSASLDLKFVYDEWNLLAELNGTNNAAVCTYLWGSDLSGTPQGAGGVGGLLLVKRASEASRFAAYDGNGNVAALIDGTTGSVSARYEYDPFGKTIRQSGTVSSGNPVGFSTKYTDAETGDMYYGYRHYWPSGGRWKSRDPINEDGGYNLFAFAANRPITAFDALGLDPVLIPNPGDYPVKPSLPKEAAGCLSAPNEDSHSKVCERYGNRRYFGASLACFCRNAPNDPWSLQVRGCLACMDSKGVDVELAHSECYAAADKKHTRPFLELLQTLLICQQGGCKHN